jgi:hypothetical protein
MPTEASAVTGIFALAPSGLGTLRIIEGYARRGTLVHAVARGSAECYERVKYCSK